MTAREDAREAIRKHLGHDDVYASSMVEVLNGGELEQIADHLCEPAGAVAIAAVIYRARLRLAAEEAEYHHQVITRTVPLPDGNAVRRGERRCYDPKTPGVRVSPDPAPDRDAAGG